jgi:hypothetical protein
MKWFALALFLFGCAENNLPCPASGICPGDEDGGFNGLACIDGRCATPYTCSPGNRSAPCPPPNGDAPWQTRCTIVLRGKNSGGPACVTPKASGTTGTPCHFTLATGAVRIPSKADSDCAPGFICYAPFYAADAPATCRPFCESDRTCAPGEACIWAFSYYLGLCYPQCDPFGAPCPEGLACIFTLSDDPEYNHTPRAICARPGTAAGHCRTPLGPSADPGADLCPAGLQCTNDPYDPSKPFTESCRQICRTLSDCSSATTCTRPDKFPCTSYPYCVCR